MKLQQLRFLAAIAKHDLNISLAAEHLHTSQPGISTQIKQLEAELGVELFARRGRNLSHITQVGKQIIHKAETILNEVANIKAIAEEYNNEYSGTMTLATTHTQARYVLPKIIERFVAEYPRVKLNFVQGTPQNISQMAVNGEADFAIATEAIATHKELIMVPAYKWNHILVVPKRHELSYAKKISLQALAEYPLVSYAKGLTGRDKIDRAFAKNGLRPNLVFTATDADVIKTYVRFGLGVGLIAEQAYADKDDSDLLKIPLDTVFEPSTTKLGFRRGTYLRKYMYRFLELFAAHLDYDFIRQVVACTSSDDLEALFKAVNISTVAALVKRQ